MRESTGTELTLADIPAPDADWSEIGEFALTFDGYKVCDSFEECANIANAQRHGSLAELRTCLFFEQRRWRHVGEEPSQGAMIYIRNVIEQIRRHVTMEENTRTMTAQEKAKAGLWLLEEAIIDYLAAHPEGVWSGKARKELGLDSADGNGQRKGYLFWGLQHVLENAGKIEYREVDGKRRVMILATGTAITSQTDNPPATS